MPKKSKKTAGRKKIDKLQSFLMRNRNKTNLQGLAEEIGCSRQYLSMFRSGKANISDKLRAKLIDSLKPIGYRH